MEKLRTETLCIQAGYTPGNGEPRQIPIIQSTTFKYATSEDMGKLFDLEAEGYFYSRLANPTCDAVAAKICALEGGTAAMLTSSGQAANFMAVFNIAGCGDHIVASSAIYGGSFNLFSVTMKKMGLETTFIDPDCTEEELNAAFRPNTKATRITVICINFIYFYSTFTTKIFKKSFLISNTSTFSLHLCFNTISRNSCTCTFYCFI